MRGRTGFGAGASGAGIGNSELRRLARGISRNALSTSGQKLGGDRKAIISKDRAAIGARGASALAGCRVGCGICAAAGSKGIDFGDQGAVFAVGFGAIGFQFAEQIRGYGRCI